MKIDKRPTISIKGDAPFDRIAVTMWVNDAGERRVSVRELPRSPYGENALSLNLGEVRSLHVMLGELLKEEDGT